MENLFKYAKKEVSQDAFLIWVISNYNCNDLVMKDISINFVKFLIKDPNITINSVIVKPQWNHIDIVADLETDRGSISIFIEDKTTGKENNQLNRYNEKIKETKKYENRESKKLFYKTDIIEEDERERIKEANWEIVELDCIKKFWEKYIDCKNIIVSMYAKRISQIVEALRTSDIPCDPKDRDLEMLMWKGFFNNYIIPNIKNECSPYVSTAIYSYTYLTIKPKGKNEEKIPFIEIRDRDCLNKKFRALILTHGMPEEKNKRCEEWDKIIKINESEKDSPFKKGRKNATKQPLATEKCEVKNKEDYLNKLKNCIDVYKNIIKKLY